MTLGEKLYALRNSKKISQEQLAYELDISKTAIVKWESNKTKPAIENLLKLCDYFETDIYKLLEEVTNINFTGAEFKGNSFAGYNQNCTVNTTTPPELYENLVKNQKTIEELLKHQNELIATILKNK